MSEWKRRTKEIPFESLPAQMVSSINRHIERYNLGLMLSDVLICIQIDSEKVKKSLFGGVEIVQGGAVLTPRWLVWAVQGTKAQAAVFSAQLINITVQDYAETPFAKMVPDSGIEVSGLFTDNNESVSAFIGLDESFAANKFKELIVKAAQDAKK